MYKNKKKGGGGRLGSIGMRFKSKRPGRKGRNRAISIDNIYLLLEPGVP